MVRVALRGPRADGWKFSWSRQDDPCATGAFAQALLLMAKSAALVPDSVAVLTCREPMPGLLTVSGRSAVVAPTTFGPKAGGVWGCTAPRAVAVPGVREN